MTLLLQDLGCFSIVLEGVPSIVAQSISENLKIPTKTLNDQKSKFTISDFQKSERDFAFVVNKDVKAQDLINVVSNVDQELISNIKAVSYTHLTLPTKA